MHKILINGAWVDALTGTSREIKNPATLELLGSVPDCGPADVARAVAAAKAAQRGWWKVPGVEKAKLLREIGARIRAREQALASLMTQETGKPLCEAVDCIDWVAACFEYLRRGGALILRQFGAAGRAPPTQLHHQGAVRRGRCDRAVQFSTAADGLEGGAGNRGRQHGGLQAAASEPAVEPQAGRSL